MSLRDKIARDEFVVCAELGPPQSCDAAVIRKKAGYFRGLVDAVNITDNQTAIVRLSSIAAGKILLEEGVEPIVQMTCRDRNRIAIQSDLLGAAAMGIENLLCLTGDHQRFGDHPEAKGVFDLDSIQLIAAVQQMNAGTLLSGQVLKKAPDFYIGAAANPFAEPLEMRLIRLEKKISSGAAFIQTQPVFDLDQFGRWLELARRRGLHERTAILAGVLPVKSLKALEYMAREVPGMRIDPAYLERMAAAAAPQEEGVTIALELIRALRAMPGVAGIHLMPVLWESITPRIIHAAGLAPAGSDLRTDS
ncbi:MAG TPA: methylenetetrahydrofolate reductase [bacterium]|nr:methylenetetrahydrofolate reductase [bacterium]HPR87644.1 methylenetetrahydrofolate reductase [bacterium]